MVCVLGSASLKLCVDLSFSCSGGWGHLYEVPSGYPCPNFLYSFEINFCTYFPLSKTLQWLWLYHSIDSSCRGFSFFSSLESSGPFSALVLFNLAAAWQKLTSSTWYILYFLHSSSRMPILLDFVCFSFPTSLVFLLCPFVVLPLLSNLHVAMPLDLVFWPS